MIPCWGTRDELLDVVEMARTGEIEVTVETVPLETVPAAYERLRAGGVTGRIVAVP